MLEWLNMSMEKPGFYEGFSESWFQYLSFIIFLILMIVFTLRYRKRSHEAIIQFIGIMSWILIVFEILKQILFTYQASGDYQWYAFPFQFCSTPMYVGLFLRYTKNDTLKTSFIMFLKTYGFFAGLAVMLYPVSVYTSSVFINIQTMVHHGGMAIMGMVLLIHQKDMSFKAFLKGFYVFLGLTGIAIVLNTIHNNFIQDGVFNMFFINGSYESQIPVISLFQPFVPNIIYILIFVIGFSCIGYLMLVLRKLLDFKHYFSS